MAEICYKPTSKSNEVCYNVMNTDVIEIGPALSISIDRNLLTGFSADFSIKSNIRSNDGLYYCKISNKHHSIVSNYIEFENIAYQFANQLSQFIPNKKIQTIKIVDFTPISLDCGRNIYSESKKQGTFAKSPFYWMFWKKFQNEQKPLSAVNDMMEYVQHQNGTLEIFHFLKMQGSMTLMCNNELSQTYYSIYKLEINIEAQSIPYNLRIRAISPASSRIVLREGPVGLKKEALSVIYYSNPVPTMIKAVWKRKNVLLSHIYPDTLSNNYNFLFPNFIDSKFTGQYNLIIEQVRPFDHSIFTFDVDVITVPKFQSKPSQILYKIVGQSADFLVEISGNDSLMEIYIDDMQIPININTNNGTELSASYKPLDQNRMELKLNFPHVTNNMTTIKSNIESGKKIIENPFSRIYTVTFIANHKNSLTSSRMSSILNVFSYPQLSADIRLDDCPLSDRYNLSYVTNADEYVKAGLEVNHMWTLTNADNQPIIDIARYVIVCNATAYLNTSTAEIIGLQLRYRLQIFHKLSTNPARVLIFDSNNHLDLVKLFHTRINCVVKSEFPIVIVAIIIALIVAILIVLILVLCLTKKKGETYNIDKNERAMGHDPEAECRENETFLNYERQNDDIPTKGSRMSLDNDSIGENSHGGELDDDGIDTASYSEEGSFIHEYSTNSKSKTEKSKDSQV